MALLRRHHKRRLKAFAWGLAGVLCVLAVLPVWARWLLAAPALLGLLVVPVLTRGGRSALGQLMFSSRQRRIAQRQPYWDPVAMKEIRPPRPPVPRWHRDVIYAADRYRCIWCRMKRGRLRADGSVVKLNLDHIQPYSLGFNISLWNSGTLCDRCNHVKSNYWQSDGGKIYYRPFAHASSMGLAGKIARREMRVRLYPWRWVRMGRAYWMRSGR